MPSMMVISMTLHLLVFDNFNMAHEVSARNILAMLDDKLFNMEWYLIEKYSD